MPFDQNFFPPLPPGTPMDTDFSSVPPTPMELMFDDAISISSPMVSPTSAITTASTVSFSTDPISPITPLSPVDTAAAGLAPTTRPAVHHQFPPPTAHLGQNTPSSFSAHRASFIRLQQQEHSEKQHQHEQNLARAPPQDAPPVPRAPPARSVAFAEKLRHMALPIAPLVQLTSGAVHPRFPGTMLAFWLLTDAELEGLAHFYHQRTPGRWSAHYPCPVAWDSAAAVEEKRRRIGRFIGLRGCESPSTAGTNAVRLWSEEELERAARRARERDEEDEMWRRKLPWY